MLLAAGFGTRLRPVTDHVPKALVPVDGRPLLDYWLHALFAADIERVLVNTHYLADQVSEFVEGSRFSDRVDLIYEETLLGTAGTVRQNADFARGEPCLVAHADNLCICDFHAFLDFHNTRPSQVAMTLMSFDAPDPTQCGIIEQDNQHIVRNFYEKVENPPSNRANAAVYVMEPEVIDFIRNIEQATPDISIDIIPNFMGHIQAWHNSRYHVDVGTLATYGMAQIAIREQLTFMRDMNWFGGNTG